MKRKLVVFVPREALDSVREALFEAGAGQIGDYERCSWYTEGTGTFLAGESASPSVGQPGREERVAELRLETVPASVDRRARASSRGKRSRARARRSLPRGADGRPPWCRARRRWRALPTRRARRRLRASVHETPRSEGAGCRHGGRAVGSSPRRQRSARPVAPTVLSAMPLPDDTPVPWSLLAAGLTRRPRPRSRGGRRARCGPCELPCT